ncbi:lytic transglycosylase domain-containing protein [Luteipulveratus sp. YIM 133132]|uniref:lytic transglycosylase domain-containing protein n=1 Tax=Luteipulveratus flavus TaxID=3031728 RepID=UPI0023AEDCAF|nr:lytic transglycosylase domain-containing protein [Luteipulveratus sp. YIM 133132]MDE9364019.1 lytic transglycosylase domain-containing protein [Luteipulveratus sp. YIM 133132]
MKALLKVSAAMIVAIVAFITLLGGRPQDAAANPCTTGGGATAVNAAATTGNTSSSGGFALPGPGEPRKDSIDRPAQSIPADYQAAYEGAAKRFGIPWTLLAGVGMEETQQGRNVRGSIAGAQGPMQFLPTTFGAFKIDGDGDGTTDIQSVPDAVYTAANYLTKSGARTGPDGVRRALWHYNQAGWYVNDVLFYAQQYGSGTVTTGGGCTPPAGGGEACKGQPGGALVGLNKGRPWLEPRLIQLGHQLQAQGWRVSEHPAFGGVHPVHGYQSLHDYHLAIDVNGPGEQDGRADDLARKLWSEGWGVQWRAPDHDDHLHIDVGLIGRIFNYGPYVDNPNADKLSCTPAPAQPKKAA